MAGWTAGSQVKVYHPQPPALTFRVSVTFSSPSGGLSGQPKYLQTPPSPANFPLQPDSFKQQIITAQHLLCAGHCAGCWDAARGLPHRVHWETDLMEPPGDSWKMERLDRAEQVMSTLQRPWLCWGWGGGLPSTRACSPRGLLPPPLPCPAETPHLPARTPDS